MKLNKLKIAKGRFKELNIEMKKLQNSLQKNLCKYLLLIFIINFY